MWKHTVYWHTNQQHMFGRWSTYTYLLICTTVCYIFCDATVRVPARSTTALCGLCVELPCAAPHCHHAESGSLSRLPLRVAVIGVLPVCYVWFVCCFFFSVGFATKTSLVFYACVAHGSIELVRFTCVLRRLHSDGMLVLSLVLSSSLVVS